MSLQLLSCSPRLRIDIRPEVANFTPKGDPLPTSPALYIQFQPGGGPAKNFRDLADKLPGLWQGVGRDEDPYETRIGWWDSNVAQVEHGWSDADREFVEAKILRIGDPNVIVVEEPRVAAPYGRYDEHRRTQGRRTVEHVVADIQQTYALAGFDVDLAVLYEQQNLNDERVIAALYALVPERASAEVEELISA